MTDEWRETAQRLMDSFLRMRGMNRLHHRGMNEKPGEMMVLYCLSVHTRDNSDGMMVSEISSKLNVTSPTITQHINSLEAQGLIERRPDPSDRRIVRIRLSEKGEQMIDHLKEARLAMFVDLAKHLGKEKSLLLADTLREASDFMAARFEAVMNAMMKEGEKRP
jgi:DNA-binding MarR family transcriptional regulator